MYTQSKQIQINPEFEDLFAFKNRQDWIHHCAKMISFRVLSEVEKVCEVKGIKKKDLAQKTKNSRSYITQLFQGTKLLNLTMMAELEDILEISFQIKAKGHGETEEQFWAKQVPIDFFLNKRVPLEGVVMYCVEGKKANDRTGEFVTMLQTEDESLQKAG